MELTLNAKFSDKGLKDSGKYYITLDAFAGTINGKAKLTLESKAEEFKTIDLTKYTPVRKGYTFKGWDLDGKIVTSINSSAFAKDAAINLTATYTQDNFEGDGIVLNIYDNSNHNFKLPILDENGSIEYMGKKYENKGVEIECL